MDEGKFAPLVPPPLVLMHREENGQFRDVFFRLGLYIHVSRDQQSAMSVIPYRIKYHVSFGLYSNCYNYRGSSVVG